MKNARKLLTPMFKSFVISYETNKKSRSEEWLDSRNRMKSHKHPDYIIAQKKRPS